MQDADLEQIRNFSFCSQLDMEVSVLPSWLVQAVPAHTTSTSFIALNTHSPC